MDSTFVVIFIVLIIVAVIAAYFAHQKFSAEKVTRESNNTASRTVQRVVGGGSTTEMKGGTPHVITASSASHSYMREPTLSLSQDNAHSSGSHHDISHSILHSFPSLKTKLTHELSSDWRREWTLMFSSSMHGSSFPRVTTAFTCSKGPTLVVIEEESSNDGKRCVFGGITHCQWTCVKERELHAKAAAASRSRVARTGVEERHNRHAEYDSSKKPSDQAPQFFGDSNCFVFTNVSPSPDDSSSCSVQDENDFKIFQTRDHGSLANSNYIYYFDTHPSSDHVGLGMGGTGARSAVGVLGGMAFFLDRSLCHGESTPGGCTTFRGSTLLTTKSHFKVRSFEIWNLNPDTIGNAEGLYMSYEDDERGDATHSALKAKDNATKKALMQMNGMTMYSEENEREDV